MTDASSPEEPSYVFATPDGEQETYESLLRQVMDIGDDLIGEKWRTQSPPPPVSPPSSFALRPGTYAWFQRRFPICGVFAAGVIALSLALMFLNEDFGWIGDIDIEQINVVTSEAVLIMRRLAKDVSVLLEPGEF
jgi:hypothetical protein